jgi:predicted metal-dependent hydrolase
MPYPVTVIRSKRRKRSVSARIVDGTMELTIPSWLSKREEAEFVEKMQKRFTRKAAKSSLDLQQRCAELAKRYDLPQPESVRWVSNQATRWGSCTTADASIRLSDRLHDMPGWVIDAVLVHELAHLVHADHGVAFHALANRFERQEEATGFLDGVSWARAHAVSSPDAGALPDAVSSPDAGGLPGNSVELEGLDVSFNATQLGLDFV